MSDNPLFGVPDLWLSVVSPKTAATVLEPDAAVETVMLSNPLVQAAFASFVEAFAPALMLEPAEDKGRWPKDMREPGGGFSGIDSLAADLVRLGCEYDRNPVPINDGFSARANLMAVLQDKSWASSQSLMSNALATAKWGG